MKHGDTKTNKIIIYNISLYFNWFTLMALKDLKETMREEFLLKNVN